ncbi:MAG: hypothetical protein QG656_226 [Candidatus Hydrogenedentes bacterium]|nr:hypothetical protein [Candidatus Hydrogenedentota bacterium]
MKTPIQALLWQEYRLIRWPIVFVFALISSNTLGIWLLPEFYQRNFPLDLIILIPFFAHIVLSWLLMFWNGGREDISTLIEPEYLILPVKTSVLMSIRLVFRLVAVNASYLLNAGVFFAIFGDRIRTDLPWGFFQDFSFSVLFLACVSFFIYVFAWSIPSISLAPLASISVVLSLASASGVIWFWQNELHSLYLRGASLVLLFAAGYAVALWGFKRYRHGGWRRPARMGSPAESVAWSPSAQPFRSPFHAQLWFEWRERGAALPLIAITVAWGLLVILAVASLVLRTPIWHSPHFIVFLDHVLFVLAPMIAAGVGMLFFLAQDEGERVGGGLHFRNTRPMHSSSMAWARLVGEGMGIGAALAPGLALWLVLAVIALTGVASLRPGEIIGPGLMAWTDLGMLVAVPLALIALMWLVLKLSYALVFLFLPFMLTATVMEVLMVRVDPSPGYFLISIFLATPVFFGIAYWRRVLTGKACLYCFLAAAMVTMVFLTVSCTSSPFWLLGVPVPLDPGPFAVCAAFGLLAVMPVAVTHLRLAWLRNR